jgi:hypothetical protein
MSGVFFSKGMTVGIPVGALTISVGGDGLPTLSLTPHLHFDVCPTWLELASQHLAQARQRQSERVAAWNSSDEDAKAATLEREFESSMQAVVAAAIAIDSFYAVLKGKAQIPAAVSAKWKENKTARYAQICEVIRTSFVLVDSDFQQIRKNVQEIFRLRGIAVHPTGVITQPVLHPELNVGVEGRFALFRAENASVVVDAAKSLISELVTKAKPKNADVQQYAEALRTRLLR